MNLRSGDTVKNLTLEQIKYIFKFANENGVGVYKWDQKSQYTDSEWEGYYSNYDGITFNGKSLYGITGQYLTTGTGRLLKVDEFMGKLGIKSYKKPPTIILKHHFSL